MAASSQATDPLILGVVASENFYTDDNRGYGIVVTRDRVLGAPKPQPLGDFGCFLGKSASDAQRAEASSVAAQLATKKDFEVRVGYVGQILFSRPSLLSGGHMILKTGMRTVRVDTDTLYVNPKIGGLWDALFNSLHEAVGWRLCDSRTGQPFRR